MYSSFGKIVCDTSRLVGLDKETYILFDKYIVSPIDVVDNNGPNARISQHSDVIRALNQEDLYGSEQNAAFKKAVEYAGTVLDIMINKYIKDKEIEKEAEIIDKENRGKDIIVLNKFYPTNPFKKEGIKFIVYRDFDRWNCNSTDQSNFRVSNKIKDDLIFGHETGSFASFKTKTAALKAAEISLCF